MSEVVIAGFEKAIRKKFGSFPRGWYCIIIEPFCIIMAFSREATFKKTGRNEIRDEKMHFAGKYQRFGYKGFKRQINMPTHMNLVLIALSSNVGLSDPEVGTGGPDTP